MNKFLFILSILIGTVVSTLGQSYTFRHYQVENGLSYNSVICSLQDKKGFLWFGTKDGLNRFDGYTFKIFRNDPDNPKSIGNNFIHSLYEDKDQNIWVGTLIGLYRYNPLNESFNLIEVTKNRDVRDIKLDSKGNIWYIAGLTLCKYNEKSKKLKTFGGRIHSGATSLSITANDEVWVSTTDGFIQKYKETKNTFENYNVFINSKPTISSWIEKLYDTGKGFFFIGTSNQGIKTFDTSTLTYKDILATNPDQTPIYARDFIAKSDDEYWIATESGLFIYNLKTGKYNNLRNKFDDPYSISDNAVYTLARDKEGGIWAGTYFGGVNYYPNQYTSFEKFFPQGGTNSLSGYAVREICNDKDGNIWIGTEDGGLNKLNHKTGVFEHFKPTGAKTSISHTNIHALLAVDNELWIGTFERGLDVMDINTSKVLRHYSAGQAPNELKSNFIESMLKTRSGEILVGTSFGLYRYNRTGNDFTLLNEVPGNLHYSNLIEDDHGTIWASSLRDGLYFYNPGNKTSGYYRHEENNRKSLSSNAVNSTFVDAKGGLWVATENGLNRFNEKEGNFRRYNSKSGFLSNVFYKILEDRKGNLWISTSRGLVCFDTSTNRIKSYTKANGLLSDQFNYSSAFKDLNGRMYFGSVKGLISFFPDQFRQNKFVSPVYITGFQIYNKEIEINKKNSPLTKSINFTDEIELAHDQSTFSIDFAALGYTAPEMTEYTFKMEGLDKNWTYLKANRKVYFTNLLPGTYTFKLKAANSSGIWSNKITELNIVIKPPLWASPLAFLFYALLIAVAIYYAIRYYHQRISNKNKRKIELWESKKEKELYHAKIEFFTYVTHEIRTPLTLIKGPLEDVMKKAEEVPAITDNLVIMKKNTNRLIELTDQLLDFRKTEIKGFNLNFVNINVSKLLEENCLRYKSAMEKKGLVLNVNLPEEPLYAYADPEALNKILSNLIDNAVKYAAGQIEIVLTSDTDTFDIEVKSDGDLIPSNMHKKIFEPFYRMESNKDQRGTGIGLPLARSLAELHEGTLMLSTDDGIRNVFSLTLPKHHEREFKINDDPLDEGQGVREASTENRNMESPVILLVEDNIEIREFIADKLIKDFQVIETANGQEALNVLNEKSIHLIISDIMMPVMDGYELCKAVKDNLEYTHIPIILLTAKNTLQSKIEGLEVGADAYLEKPFSPDHLLTQISNLLASRDKIKNYFASSPLVHIKSMAYNKADEAFLEKLNEIINKNIDNKSLDVDLLADAMNMSRPTLYRKIKAISNLSPHELINITRLKKAAELLVEGNYKILKIASMTGFSSQAQFGRCFVKQFGMTPSEYAGSKHLVSTEME
ncbi:hybrid sensor histidine kinase/response regulator [Pedobacter ginsengisoli]|uniref:histidine kinase n=1 Tax=Pedobacter ginsengisoli TaxID=363852 RepID=A0A2D1U5H7_9SPHI|nr:hybrid sensor histidine kinase/response regulator transcription factor [Pedobacter ginsengisoli]ATP56857.1 hybrid sensor histidine kinase/response regulator [Pedobacter ginsengisoli]